MAEAAKKEKDKTNAIRKIDDVFRVADRDGNGELTRDEFLDAVKNNVQENLQDVGTKAAFVEVRKPRSLWDAPGPLQDNTEAAATELKNSAKFLASVKPSEPSPDVKPSEPIPDVVKPSEPIPDMPSKMAVSEDQGLPEESSRNCIDARPSLIKDAGKGLFATCEISAGLRIGEYLGERRMSPSFNHAYEWSVPICTRPHVVVHGNDDVASCGEVGKEYIDGAVDTGDNPLRFVNGVNSPDQRPTLNVSPIFYDGRVFYVTTRDVHVGEEFIIDYGAKYWKAHNSLSEYWKVVHPEKTTQ